MFYISKLDLKKKTEWKEISKWAQFEHSKKWPNNSVGQIFISKI